MIHYIFIIFIILNVTLFLLKETLKYSIYKFKKDY